MRLASAAGTVLSFEVMKAGIRAMRRRVAGSEAALEVFEFLVPGFESVKLDVSSPWLREVTGAYRSLRFESIRDVDISAQRAYCSARKARIFTSLWSLGLLVHFYYYSQP